MDRSASASSFSSLSSAASSTSSFRQPQTLQPVSVRKPAGSGSLLSTTGGQLAHKRVAESSPAPHRALASPGLRLSVNRRRKPRPTTAVALSSTATLDAMLGATESAAERESRLQQQLMRPESAQPADRRGSIVTLITPLAGVTSSAATLLQPPGGAQGAWATAASPSAVVVPSSQSPAPSASASRCAGCGGFAEMCLGCFTHFKQQDGARYKTQLVRAVDSLFERATARAFTRMAAVVLQWVFRGWQAAARRAKWRRALAARLLRRQQVRRLWTEWQIFLYERRIVGAMLFAEAQQRETTDKAQEVARLHGDSFEQASAARVHEALQRDVVGALEAQLAATRATLQAKDRELLELRHEIRGLRATLETLEAQAIDPRELERLRVESLEYKKASFQLVGALTQTLEAQVKQLSTSDGRQNLSDVFSRDVLQALDKPENAAFYNPLVDLETVTSKNSTGASREGNLFVAYEASVDRADVILTQWVNSLVARQPEGWLGAPRMLNFHSSLSDGKVLAVVTKLLHAAMARTRLRRPPGASERASKLEASSMLRENGEELTAIAMERYLEHLRREPNADKRLELMISTLGQALWLPLGLLNAKDIRAGHAEFNFAALTYLFVTFSPCLTPEYYTLCSSFAQQLESVKARWRDLQGDGMAAGSGAAAVVAAAATGDGSEVGEEASVSMRVKLALSQTLELKRRLDAEDARSREGHALWTKAERIVMRKCFLSYARLARGKVGVLAKLDSSLGDENEPFAKLPKHKLVDLALPYEDFAWESKLLQSFLGTIYCDLGRIYRGYATRAGVAQETISVADFTELLVDCRVLEGNMGHTDLHAILRLLDPNSKSMNPHRALPPIEFLEALVRVGRRKYSPETHRVTISEAFCLFMDNFILPFAFRADADLFRRQLEEPTIRRLLIKYNDDLKGLYDKYAVEDPKHKSREPRLTAYTFSQCLLDRGVLDMSLTTDKVLGIVAKVARGAAATAAAAAAAAASSQNSLAAEARANEDEDVSYEEFEEALVAVACHKFPDPYISLESRVERFFSIYVRERAS